MATLEQLSAALMKADAAGNSADAKVFADEIRKMRSAAPTKAAVQPQQEFGTEVPKWGRENPNFYGAMGALRETLGTPFEALTGAIGGVVGTGGGPIGSVVGAGLGYGAGKAVTRLADEALGNTRRVGAVEGITRAASDVGEGALMEGIGRMAVPAIAKGVGWVGDRLVGPSMAKLRAAQIARDTAGPKLAQVRQALSQSRPGVSAGQLVEEAGINAPAFQSLDAMGARNNSMLSTDQMLKQAADRAAALNQVAPDAVAAREVRKVFSPMNYEAAFALDDARLVDLAQKRAHNATFGGAGGGVPVQPLIPELQALKGIPEIDAAIKEAKTRIAGNGDPMETLRGLHKMKEVLDSWSKSPVLPNSLQNSDKRAIGEATRKLVDVMDSMSPEYAVARAKDAAMRVPENQGNLLNNLGSILNNKGVGENKLAFLNAIGRGEDAALKGAGINPKFGTIDETLNAPQNSVVRKIGDELTRDIRMDKSATLGNTELTKILNQDTFSLRRMIPAWFNRGVSTATKGLDLAEAAIDKATLRAIADARMSGQSMGDLMDTLPMSERNKILKAMVAKDPSLMTRFARNIPMVGSVNALSPNENQNALTQP